jgi:K+-sensing histidine kinase KdpD
MSDVTPTMNCFKAQKNIEFLTFLQSNVSHDMRAPLSAISQMIDMLLNQKFVFPEKVRKCLLTVKSSSTILNNYVNDLLDRNLITKGQFVEIVSRINPREVI